MARRDVLNRLKEQERETRKNLILDAAERVFATKPYDKVSIKEIADEAGMAPSSIYTYFTGQETLFLDASIRETDILTQKFRDIIARPASPEERLGLAIDAFVDYIARNESYFRMQVLFMTHGSLTEESLERMNAAMREAFSVLDGLFTGLRFRGKVRKLTHFLFAALNGILVTYRKLPGRDEEKVIAYMKELGCLLKELIVALSRARKEGDDEQAPR